MAYPNLKKHVMWSSRHARQCTRVSQSDAITHSFFHRQGVKRGQKKACPVFLILREPTASHSLKRQSQDPSKAISCTSATCLHPLGVAEGAVQIWLSSTCKMKPILPYQKVEKCLYMSSALALTFFFVRHLVQELRRPRKRQLYSCLRGSDCAFFSFVGRANIKTF